ncbi:WSC domain-containing protein [Podospora australis]|uniref:WSC domain-containing protein n=1 Tax=Podospora australis TaxID=1536484 RepID=A0AAN6WUT4_9PEZI|nr:WSC domain-containing protein [Podospora australis]
MTSTRWPGLSQATSSLLYLLSFSSLTQAVSIPTQSSSVNLGDYKYQGCYTDNRDAHTLTGKRHFDDAMTLKKCATACSAYQWFGVTFGSQCFCGTSLAEVAEKRPEEECGMVCGGSRCQKCGDADRINVYWTGKETTAVEPPTVGSFEYKSCWTDNRDDRSLKGGKHQRPDLTVEACAEICEGYTYFGLESTSECMCGNELGGEAAPEEECSELCPGNPEQWCGGADRLNVYQVKSSMTSESIPESTTSSESSTSTESIAESTTTTTEAESTTTSESVPESTTTADESTTAPESETITSTEIESTTSEAESSTTPEPETTSTSEAESTTITLPPDETETTSSEEIITPTPTPTSTSSEVITTSNCTPTTTILADPATCWAAIPTPCSTLNRTPAIPYPANTAFASQCRNAFLVGGSPVPAVAGCFENIGRPQFVATSAYSCVAAADVLCRTGTVAVCDGATATPTDGSSGPVSTNALDPDGGFERGTLWTGTRTDSGNDDIIRVSVSSEQVHSGNHAMKVEFSGANAGSRGWTQPISGLAPGVEYEYSMWFWTENTSANTVIRLQFNGGGVTFLADASTMQLGRAGQWTRYSYRFTTVTTFGSVYFSVYGNRGAANVFYVDDMSIARV